MVKIKVILDKSSLRMALGHVHKLLEYNTAKVIKDEALPALVRAIMVGFDSLSDRADMLPEDPTNPSNWRAEFEAKLWEDLANTFIINGSVIQVHLGERSFLGYDSSNQSDPEDTSPLHWMVYYLEGLAEDWAFISPDRYEQLTGHDYQPSWGRFSQGFMMPRKEYFKRGFDRIVPFQDVRHPFSGYAPLDIFTEALREFRLAPFVKKAIAATVRGDKL